MAFHPMKSITVFASLGLCPLPLIAMDSPAALVYAPYFYLALAFMAGGAVIWYVVRGSERFHVGRRDTHIAALLSSANASFYYRNLDKDREWFSRRLRELLSLPLGASYPDLQHCLSAAAAEELDSAVTELLDEKRESFTLHIEDEVNKRLLECYGVVVIAEKQRHLVLWWQDATERMHEMKRLRHENERVKLELRQLSNMFNALPMPVWQRDKNLKIHYCNLAFLEASEETLTDSGSESLEIYPQAPRLAEKALKTGKKQHDPRHVVLQGERKRYDFIEIPWEDRKHLTGIALDKTDVEVLNDRLQDVLLTQENLLESTNSGVAIFSANQRLKFYNHAFLKLWKLEENWLMQRPSYSELLEKLRENRLLPEQSNFPAFKQKAQRKFTDLLEPSEEYFYLPDGRTIRSLAIPEASGGILFADEDVTDRLALERSYNTLIAVQRETLDHLHEGVAVFGQDGRLKLYNPVYLQMWRIDAEVAKNEPHINDLLEKQKKLYDFNNWDEFKGQFVKMLGLRESASLRINRKDNRSYDLSSVPLPDGQTLLAYVDQTDTVLVERSLREKNEALEEADRLKSEFLANVSYELRSPLTSIRGFYEMLHQGYLGELTKKQLDYVENIGEASGHLMSLIDDVLDVASIEAGYMQLSIRRFDVVTLLSSVQSMIRERADTAKIALHFDCPLDIGEIEGDFGRLQQALFNLMSNAVKYTDEGGEITLSAQGKARPERIAITVKDTGIGIAKADQPYVFDKFYRGTAAGRRRSGTGLGLSMVKSFVDMHHGELTLKSKQGKGTEITCILPRKQPK